MITPGPRVIEEPWYTSSPFEPTAPGPKSLEEIDLTDPGLYVSGDPHAAWKLLRDKAPVFWHEKGAPGTEGKGFWALTRHAEFMEVLRDAGTFSSEWSPFLDVTAEQLGEQIAVMNPPRHTGYRRVVQRYFTRRAVLEWEQRLRETVTAVLDSVSGRGECDFATDVALQIPVRATADFFGLSPDEGERLQKVQEVLHAAGTPEALAEYTECGLQLFGEVIYARRSNPKDDLIGAILSGKPEGETLSDEAALLYLWVLFLGGLDATVHAGSSALMTLFQHRDQMERLQRDPSLLGTGVEEILRWISVSQHLKRRVTRDTEIGGQPIKAGDYVCVFQPSANRDEAVFENPFRLDVGRQNNPTAAFGHGSHLCPGIHLARMELSMIVEQVLRRLPDVEQAGPTVRAPSFTVLLSPVKHLPVRFTPAERVH